MKHITILALQRALASSMTIPLEMFSAAETIRRIRAGRRRGALRITIASDRDGPAELTGGVTLLPHAKVQQIDYSDLVFVPALWGNPLASLRHHPRVLEWLDRQYGQGATLCSVGSGSFFPAEAGLLTGRRATTHWRYFDAFEQRYPGVELQRSRFITQDERLYCTGSINAVRDVTLHFLEQLFDNRIADEVARHFTHELMRSWESRLLAGEQQDVHHDEQIIKIQEWLQTHYAARVSIQALARRFGINPRSLNRRFRQATGKPPLQYLQEIRINQARELLKHSNLGIAEIAYAVGYQDVSYFTGLFRRTAKVTPNEYRRLVRGKIFNVDR